MRAELDEAGDVWAAKFRAATSDEERSQLRVYNSYRAFEPRFLEFARAHATEPVAMEAVQWLAETANPGNDLDGGLELVQRHHLEDERIIKIGRTLVFRSSPGIERFLLAVAGKHSDHATQGVAYLCLARHLHRFRDFVVAFNKMDEKHQEPFQHRFDEKSEEIVAWIRSTDPTQLAAHIDAIGKKIINESGDVNDDEYADATGRSRSIADAVRALRVCRNPVGSIAPDCIGQLADGTQINLKDQRGKVVLLSFSANWCGPCKEMYGQFRELMELYADTPFTVMAVMADDKKATVAEAVDAGEITWPAIWDGKDGPIGSAWYFTGYPTVFLIDRESRIQSEGLRDDSLDDEVARMLEIRSESRVNVDKRLRVWHMSLQGRDISDDELPKLMEGYTEPRSLDLQGNPITDRALIHLSPITKLETLNLRQTKVTDEGLLSLSSLKNLKQLYVQHIVSGEGVSTAAIRRLVGELPGLNVRFITD